MTRLIIQIGESDYRKFLWFDLRGSDFYWGTSEKVAAIIKNEKIENKLLNIKLPDNYYSETKGSTHFALHESGEFHHKKEIKGEPIKYSSKKQMMNINKLDKIVRLCSMITRSFDNYSEHLKSITANKSNAFLLKIDEIHKKHHAYVELFLSKVPTNQFQEPFIKMFEQIETNPINIKIAEELYLILTLRVFTGMAEEDSDKQVTFIED